MPVAFRLIMTCMPCLVKHHRKMNVGERIRLLRERKRMSATHLAARAGLDQSYLSKVEKGKAGYTGDGLAKIVAGLGTTMADFFGTANVEEVRLQDSIQVPILDYVQAGLPVEIAATFGPDDVLGYVAVDAPGAAPNDIFGMLIKGTSMLPDFNQGDCVIMQRSLSPQPGDYVVAVNGEGESVFKRYRVVKTDEQGRTVFALVPTNSDFPTMTSDELPLLVRATMIEHRIYRRR